MKRIVFQPRVEKVTKETTRYCDTCLEKFKEGDNVLRLAPLGPPDENDDWFAVAKVFGDMDFHLDAEHLCINDFFATFEGLVRDAMAIRDAALAAQRSPGAPAVPYRRIVVNLQHE